MFERFTEQARLVVVQAQLEARELGHAYIGTEHLLLGLLADVGETAAQALDSFGVEAGEVRRRVIEVVGSGRPVPSGQIPFTPSAKKALEASLREALSLGHDYIGTGHVLLGLIRIDDGLPSRILLDLNVQPDDLRNATIERLGEPQRETAPTARIHQVIRPATGEVASGVQFTVEPDPALRRLLMAAGGHALKDEREQFSFGDLLAVARELPRFRELLDAGGEGDTAQGA